MFVRLRNRFKVRANLERLDQHKKAREFMKGVIALASEKRYSIGAILWFCLPLQAAKVVALTDIDPYRVGFSQLQLLEWIENHLVFGEDIQIVGVHDYGKLMWSDGDIDMEWYFTKEHRNGNS